MKKVLTHWPRPRTLKYEFGLIKTIPSLEVANKMLKEAVEVYNN